MRLTKEQVDAIPTIGGPDCPFCKRGFGPDEQFRWWLTFATDGTKKQKAHEECIRTFK